MPNSSFHIGTITPQVFFIGRVLNRLYQGPMMEGQLMNILLKILDFLIIFYQVVLHRFDIQVSVGSMSAQVNGVNC